MFELKGKTCWWKIIWLSCIYIYSHSHFIFYWKLSKVTADYISELINLNYFFNIPFKCSLKTIIMGSFSILWWCRFKNSTKILEVILMHLFKSCHEDGYDKINELSNFRCNLISSFDKLKDTANELSSKNFFEDLELNLKQ